MIPPGGASPATAVEDDDAVDGVVVGGVVELPGADPGGTSALVEPGRSVEVLEVLVLPVVVVDAGVVDPPGPDGLPGPPGGVPGAVLPDDLCEAHCGFVTSARRADAVVLVSALSAALSGVYPKGRSPSLVPETWPAAAA